MTSNATRTLRLAAFMMMTTLVAVAIRRAGRRRLIALPAGQVQGPRERRRTEFLGIPYAAPPIGALRWRPPAPVVPWGGVLDASAYSSPCAQLPSLTGTASEQEDCLYLNVWTPDPAPAEPRPVMVWIHGGSNMVGSTGDFVPFPPFQDVRLYDAHRLAALRNVVVVTLNYRVGVFGFFGHTALGVRRRGLSVRREPGAARSARGARRGCAITSPRSAAIRATSRSSASPRDPGTCARTWRPRCRMDSFIAPSVKVAAARPASQPRPRPRPPQPTSVRRSGAARRPTSWRACARRRCRRCSTPSAMARRSASREAS